MMALDIRSTQWIRNDGQVQFLPKRVVNRDLICRRKLQIRAYLKTSVLWN